MCFQILVVVSLVSVAKLLVQVLISSICDWNLGLGAGALVFMNRNGGVFFKKRKTFDECLKENIYL